MLIDWRQATQTAGESGGRLPEGEIGAGLSRRGIAASCVDRAKIGVIQDEAR